MKKNIINILVLASLFMGCSIKTNMSDGRNSVKVQNTQNTNYITTFSNQKTNTQLAQMKEAFEQAKQDNTVKAYEEYIAHYPHSYYEANAKELIAKKKLENKNNPELKKRILKNVKKYLAAKDVDGLMKYADDNPEVKEFARDHPAIYLLFTGPKELQVGKILHYKKQGIKDPVLISKIKANNQPYRNYTLDEISVLAELGITDSIMQAMLDITTTCEKDNRLQQAEAERLRQQRQLQQQQAKSVYQQPQQTQQTNTGSNAAGEIGKEVLKGLIKNLF